jgi:hypothetical protein
LLNGRGIREVGENIVEKMGEKMGEKMREDRRGMLRKREETAIFRA